MKTKDEQSGLSFTHESVSRILNDGQVNVISGPPEDLEKIAEAFEKEVPHLCGWLVRKKDTKTGRFMKGYTKNESEEEKTAQFPATNTITL